MNVYFYSMFLKLIFIKSYSLEGNLDIVYSIQHFFFFGSEIFFNTILCRSLIYKTGKSETILVEAGKGGESASNFS